MKKVFDLIDKTSDIFLNRTELASFLSCSTYTVKKYFGDGKKVYSPQNNSDYWTIPENLYRRKDILKMIILDKHRSLFREKVYQFLNKVEEFIRNQELEEIRSFINKKIQNKKKW